MRPLTVRVRSRVQPTCAVVVLELEPVGDVELPPYEPGAHIDLVLANGMVRQYSLLPPPPGRSTWRVAVLREATGRGGSAYVHDSVQVGTTLTVIGPRNHFKLLPAAGYVFIAGGIGITPLLGMIEAAERAEIPWQLFYAGRARREMAFLAELQRRYAYRVSPHAGDTHGRLDVTEVVRRAGLDTLVYCCGPEPMTREAEAAGADRPGLVRVERFTPAELPPPSADTPFEVELVRSGERLAVPAGTSLLDVLDDAGVFVISSCQEGTCGSCETGVLDGVVDHRDSVLTAEEQAAGNTMMVCVSRALSPSLTLDI
jgi:ferredoxin-NADP reductase